MFLPELAEQGARIGTVEVIRCDIVCVVTSDERGLIRLVEDPERDVAQKLPAVIILCSAARPDAAIALGDRLAAIGTHLVEAPVSGGAEAASAPITPSGESLCSGL